MITGASWKPFSAVRSPVVSLNENVPPGRDQGPVDQLGNELHVVEAARRTAVGRRVRRDDTRDAHRLRVRGRPGRLGDADDELCRSLCSVENAAAAIAFAVAGISSRSPGADGRTTIFPVAVTWKRASCGLRETVAERRSQVLLGSAPRECDIGVPRGRELMQGRDLPPRDAPAGLAVGEPDRPGEGDAGLRRRFLEIGRVDAKRRRRERECDRRTSVETSKGLDDDEPRPRPGRASGRPGPRRPAR